MRLLTMSSQITPAIFKRELKYTEGNEINNNLYIPLVD
jgi:hypothetical protein